MADEKEAKWYVVHTYSGYENKVKADLEKTIENNKALAEQIVEVRVPVEDVVEIKNGKMIELTQVEFQIMEYFFSNPGVALDRIDILNHVWGDAYVGEDKIVDVNIRRLRMKVEDEPSNPKHIITVWGLGYKWDSGE